MPLAHTPPPQQAGFSLIFVAILLTVAALIFVSFLPGKEAGDINQKTITNVNKLERVEEAMRAFMAFNGRRPCPADGSSAITSATFGVETDTLGDGNCTGAPLGPDATGFIVAGTIPTRSLGLPSEYAFDEFGRRYTYVVDKRATSNTGCLTLEGITATNSTPVKKGGIVINNSTTGTLIDNTMYAYISHGRSGYGAFPAQGNGTRINSGSTDGDMQTNAGVDAHFPNGASAFTANFTNIKVKKDRVAPTAGDTGFDDLVWYRPDTANLCAIGPLSLTPPQVGFIVDGYQYYQESGDIVFSGDINGDGIPDLIIGGPGGSGGQVYVIFGTKNGFPDPLPLNTINGTNGFEIDLSFTNYCIAVGSIAIGDINGDGSADIVIGGGTGGYPCQYSGTAVYVVFGGATRKDGVSWSSCLPCTTNTLTNGVNGFMVYGTTGRWAANAAGNWVGLPVVTADVNGDGITDIITGASYASTIGNWTNNGAVYVLYGGKTGTNNSNPNGTPWTSCPCVFSSGFLNGINGVEFDGAAAGYGMGRQLAVADVNGSGGPDIIIGVPSATSPGSVRAGNGEVYIVFNGTSAVPVTTVTTTNGSTTAIVGSTAGLAVGQTLNSLYIQNSTTITACPTTGMPAGTPCTSTILTLSLPASGGGALPVTQPMSVAMTIDSTFLNGVNGIEFDGAVVGPGSTALGNTINTADVNDDGIPDLLIGNGNDSLYVVFGETALLPTPMVTTTIGSTTATVDSFAGLMVGQGVFSANYITTPGTTITACPTVGNPVGTPCTSTTLTLSDAAANTTPTPKPMTISGGNILPMPSVTTTSGSTTATVNSFAGLMVGQRVFSPGYITTPGTTITACPTVGNPVGTLCTSSTLTLSAAATNTTPTPKPMAIASSLLNSTFINGVQGFQLDFPVGGMYNIATGDINGDGVPDILINFPGVGSGTVYAVFGHKCGRLWPTPCTVDTTVNSAFLNGTNGSQFFVPSGPGGSVVGAGDVNGDGIPDLIIGSNANTVGSNSFAGQTYVFFGKKTGWPTTPYDLSGL